MEGMLVCLGVVMFMGATLLGFVRGLDAKTSYAFVGWFMLGITVGFIVLWGFIGLATSM